MEKGYEGRELVVVVVVVEEAKRMYIYHKSKESMGEENGRGNKGVSSVDDEAEETSSRRSREERRINKNVNKREKEMVKEDGFCGENEGRERKKYKIFAKGCI